MIKLLITDIDGCLTDGQIYYGAISSERAANPQASGEPAAASPAAESAASPASFADSASATSPAVAEPLKAFCVLDGAAIKRAQKQGRTVAFISGRDSAALRARAADLGVVHTALGCKDKLAAAEQIAAELGLNLATKAAHLGDDLIDLALLKACAYAFVPADARALFGHRLARRGGEGCFFEMLEFLCSRNL